MNAESNSVVQTFHGRTDEIPESIKACKTRAVLTEEQAVQIFMMKISDTKSFNKSIHAQEIAISFGISEKTVRDIWKGRTWRRETMHLDVNYIEGSSNLRLPGRPKGSISKSKSSLRVRLMTSLIKRTKQSFGYLMNPAQYSSYTGTGTNATRTLQSSYFVESPSAMTEGLNTAHRQLSPWSSESTPEMRANFTGDSSWFTEAVEPLPESSHADDPFHNEWLHWDRSFELPQ